MYDRPHANELLDASCQHIEDNILPLVKAHNFKLYFQTLVAVNVLRIIGRELQLRDAHLQGAWRRLVVLLGEDATMPTTSTQLGQAVATYHEALCQQIRAGERDDDDELFDHLLQHSIDQLSVANPKLLATLAHEDAS